MNPLSELLSDLKISGSVYFCDYLKPPWAMDHRDEPRAMFHMVRRGRCIFEANKQRIELAAGDFVFVSAAVDHQVHALPNDTLDSLLLCGFCTFSTEHGDLLLRDMPDFKVLTSDTLQDYTWLRRTLEHLSAEYLSDEPSVEITLNKLTEILIIQLLRSEFGEQKNVGLIAAMRNKKLAIALTAIHENLAQPWTIESAAQEASMSRSGFARIFTDTLRISFYEYITQIRVKRAKNLLKTSQLTVAEIGQSVGYQSDLSFVKVFKKMTGVTPRAYRYQST